MSVLILIEKPMQLDIASKCPHFAVSVILLCVSSVVDLVSSQTTAACSIEKYQLVRTPATFSNAVSGCRDIHGTLASPKSQQDLQKLRDLTAGADQSWFWWINQTRGKKCVAKRHKIDWDYENRRNCTRKMRYICQFTEMHRRECKLRLAFMKNKDQEMSISRQRMKMIMKMYYIINSENKIQLSEEMFSDIFNSMDVDTPKDGVISEEEYVIKAMTEDAYYDWFIKSLFDNHNLGKSTSNSARISVSLQQLLFVSIPFYIQTCFMTYRFSTYKIAWER